MWLNRWHVVPPIVLAAACFAIGGFSGLLWGFGISTVLLWHATYSINSLAHRWGTRRYDTPDTSRNNLLLGLLTLGEGWHNNHHHYCASARQGFFWWEIDVSYYLLRALAAVGLDLGRARAARPRGAAAPRTGDPLRPERSAQEPVETGGQDRGRAELDQEPALRGLAPQRDPQQRPADGDDHELTELHPEIEAEQRGRDPPGREPDLRQHPREAEAVDQPEDEGDQPAQPRRARQRARAAPASRARTARRRAARWPAARARPAPRRSAAATRPAPSASMIAAARRAPGREREVLERDDRDREPDQRLDRRERGVTTPSTPSASVTLCATVKPVTIVATSANDAPSSSSASRKTR